MNRFCHVIAVCIACVMTMHIKASEDFSRYDVILERRPFGARVEEPVAPPVSDEPPAFVNELRMVAMTESPAGVRVGFLDTQHRPPRTYFLYVGETEDGLLLADADFDSEQALVSKDGEQYWMRMGEAQSAPQNAGTSEREGRGRRRSPDRGSRDRGVVRASGGNGDGTPESYAARRRQRLEEMRRRAEESRQLSEEEVERQLREYQMRLIREGRTPLPIPITEEMDAQLVSEGILPPAD